VRARWGRGLWYHVVKSTPVKNYRGRSGPTSVRICVCELVCFECRMDGTAMRVRNTPDDNDPLHATKASPISSHVFARAVYASYQHSMILADLCSLWWSQVVEFAKVREDCICTAPSWTCMCHVPGSFSCGLVWVLFSVSWYVYRRCKKRLPRFECRGQTSHSALGSE
jgi:hypothetical protein